MYGRNERIAVFVFVLAIGAPLAAEAPYQVAWSRQVGTPARDWSWSVDTDGDGRVYIAGQTDGSLGAPNAGLTDAFLAKYDAAGDASWARQLGTSRKDYARSMALDLSGNAYTTGWREGSLAGTSAGSDDVFLAKYDGAGNLLWSRQIGTTSPELGSSVAVTRSGNAYVTGWTAGSLGGPNVGHDDGFLLKYDASGKLLWSRQFGTSMRDRAGAVAVDASGNAYISGYTGGSLGGPNAGNGDAFLMKYDASGSLLWSRQFGTTDYDASGSVAVDVDANAYISGVTEGSLDAPNAGKLDAFLGKYDRSGNLLWSRQIGTSATEVSRSVAVGARGNAYISGETNGVLGETSSGGTDAFLIKWGASGDLLWSQQIGSSRRDYSRSVAVDDLGNAYISGLTDGRLGGPRVGSWDAFLVKLVPEPAALSLLGLGALAVLRRRRRQ